METRSTLDAIGAGECPTESDDNDARHTQAQLAQGQIRTAAGGGVWVSPSTFRKGGGGVGGERIKDTLCRPLIARTSLEPLFILLTRCEMQWRGLASRPKKTHNS